MDKYNKMRSASQSYIHGVLNALSTRLENKNMARVMSSSSALMLFRQLTSMR